MAHSEAPVEDIMVIKTRFLPDIQSGGKGFVPADFTLETFLLENCDFMKVVYAERNPSYKEVIPYAVIYNSHLKKILVYQERDEKVPENLFARIVLGLKIYVKKFTGSKVNILRDTVMESLQKYFFINFAHIASVNLLGYVYDEESIEERSKIWLFYFVEILGESEHLENTYFSYAQYMNREDLELYITSWEVQVGYWSKLVFPHLLERVQEIEAKNN